jgi:membrane protein
LLVIAGFSLIYWVLPNFPVQRKHALIGGTFAGFLFNGLKWAFSYYVVEVASYQQIYGALAAIPIFLMWMYVSWVIVIMGAELAAALPEWAAGRRIATRDVASVRRLEVAVAVLARLHKQSHDMEGGPVPDAALQRDVGVGADLLDSVIESLLHSGFIARAASGGWLLARDLEHARLYDLFEVLGFSLGRLPSPMAGDHVWHKRFLAAIDKLEAANRDALASNLRALLAPEPTAVTEDEVAQAPEPVSLRS